MTENPDFDLQDFLPYALNRAAEVTGLQFQTVYKARYGMLRTEWRVLFHLGRHGAMTAKQICDRAGMHKTKVSRAVAALAAKHYLTRETMPSDRRNELLSLTRAGRHVFNDLRAEAQRYDATLAARLSPSDSAVLRRCLAQIAGGSR